MIERCILCGGKLSEGRCTECGLDNTKSDKKYHLNLHNEKEVPFHEGSCEANLNRKKRRKKKERTETPGHRQWYMGWRLPGVEEPEKKKRKKKKEQQRSSAARKMKWVIFLILFFSFLMPLLSAIFAFVQEKTEDASPAYVGRSTLSVPLQEEFPLNWDGSGAMELQPGFYMVGYELPEGRYTLEVSDSSGLTFSYQQDSQEKAKETQRIQAEDMEDSELPSSYEDLVLEEGGWLFVQDITGTAVLYAQEFQDTKLSGHEPQENLEERELLPGERLEAGKDFPAGVYDLEIRGSEKNPDAFLFQGIVAELGTGESWEEDPMLFLWNQAPRIYRLPLEEGAVLDGSYLTEDDSEGAGRVFLVPSF